MNIGMTLQDQSLVTLLNYITRIQTVKYENFYEDLAGDSETNLTPQTMKSRDLY